MKGTLTPMKHVIEHSYASHTDIETSQNKIKLPSAYISHVV